MVADGKQMGYQVGRTQVVGPHGCVDFWSLGRLTRGILVIRHDCTNLKLAPPPFLRHEAIQRSAGETPQNGAPHSEPSGVGSHSRLEVLQRGFLEA